MAQFDSLTTRMPGGVTNAAPWQTMGASGVPDPTWAHVYANDFDTYAAGDWTIALTGTGTVAKTDFDGGAILLSNTAGATDAQYVQLTNAGFKMLPNKAAFFKFAGQMSDIANDVFYAGLVQKGATTLASITDGVFISKTTSNSGALTLNVRQGGTAYTAAFPALEAIAANTYFELGFMVDYLGNVAAFFNPTTGSNPISAAAAASSQARGRVAALYANGGPGPIPASQAAPIVLPTALLTPAFGLLNASAATRTLTVDYLVATRER
jgi:hypothetical protein